MYKLFFFFIFSNIFIACGAQNNASNNSIGIISYNVENLYDTVNDPNKDDDEFLPASDKKWDEEKYKTKIDHIATVIASASDKLPILVGLVEIENETVLKDLIASDKLRAGNYGIIHFDSPDERGIDVALLYNKDIFKPKKYYPIQVNLPGETKDYTRDILFVFGEIKNGNASVPINIFVNHWPSRAEGEEISAPKRMAAAQTLKSAVDSLNSKFKNPYIIIMGDFNDTPFDKSITEILQAGEPDLSCKNNCLVDLMYDMQKNNLGSYNYKGNWQALDQFIVSKSLIANGSLDVDINTAAFVKKEFMLYHSDKYGDLPNRTYSGNSYHAGYSDHLPIYIQLKLH